VVDPVNSFSRLQMMNLHQNKRVWSKILKRENQNSQSSQVQILVKSNLQKKNLKSKLGSPNTWKRIHSTKLNSEKSRSKSGKSLTEWVSKTWQTCFNNWLTKLNGKPSGKEIKCCSAKRILTFSSRWLELTRWWTQSCQSIVSLFQPYNVSMAQLSLHPFLNNFSRTFKTPM
jgi:hypothetical protein